MKQQIYAVYDTCAGIYDSPHFANSDDLVKRQFQDIASGTDNPIAKHPEHYSLWRLGAWDNTTGKINDEKNECLCTALEIISQSQTVENIQTIGGNGPLKDVEFDANPELYKPGLTD